MITRRFQNWSVQNKLLALMLLMAVCVLTLTTIGNIYNTKKSILQLQVTDVKATARLVAYNINAALAFNDETTLKQAFSSLETDESIMAGVVLDDKNQLVYEWNNDKASRHLLMDSLPWQDSDEETQLKNGVLYVYENIVLDDQVIGHLLLVDNLSELTQIFYANISSSIWVLLLTLVCAYLLAVKLQGLISSPLSQLISAMEKVSNNRDYNIYIDNDRQDEFGHLIDHFNSMLKQIKHRDETLEAYRAKLEAEVLKRTKELELTNQELKENVENLSIAKEHAEEASRAKTQFLATVSHEIRTPMNGILGLSELLKGTTLTPQQSTFIQSIHNSGKSLLAIINDVLDFSKIESEKLLLDEYSFDYISLVEDVIQCFIGAIKDKKINLIVDIDPNIPKEVMGDANRLRQVLVNLIGNAIKFTEQGVIEVSTEVVALGYRDVSILFKVKDTGIGMTEVNKQKIFEAFAQADDSITRQFGGTGLGLTISQRLLCAMGSTIEVISEPNRGSEFSFVITLSRLENEGEKYQLPQFESEPYLALIVDTNVKRSEVLKKLCEHCQINVITAFDVQSALRIYRLYLQHGKPFKIVFCQHDEDLKDFINKLSKVDTYLQSKLVLMEPFFKWPNTLSTKEIEADAVINQPVMPTHFTEVMAKLFSRCQPAKRNDLDRNPDEAAICQSGTILFVEDNEINLLVGVSMLEELGFDVIQAKNGHEALKLFEEHQLCLILMDYHMPEMDGLTVTQKIRDMEKARTLEPVPIFVLTADISKEMPELCQASEANGYLAKPFSKVQLAEILQNKLSNSASSTECCQSLGEQPIYQALDPQVLSQLNKLQRQGQPDILITVFNMFKTSTNKLLEDYAAALENADFTVAFQSLHILKSSSANIGALRLSSLCSELELNVKEKKLESLEEKHHSLKQYINQVYEDIDLLCRE